MIIKLKRLVNSLEGPARAAVARYDFVAENYDRILQVLEMRYGQPHLVMLTFNRKMQAHKAVSELDAKGFLNFVDLATQYVKNMQTICTWDGQVCVLSTGHHPVEAVPCHSGAVGAVYG